MTPHKDCPPAVESPLEVPFGAPQKTLWQPRVAIASRKQTLSLANIVHGQTPNHSVAVGRVGALSLKLLDYFVTKDGGPSAELFQQRLAPRTAET